ncbi:MAG: hypothetical protein MI919_37110, partial [Holophagales bacterium]|nr:hypothetical protein [Holophagales bacterium]
MATESLLVLRSDGGFQLDLICDLDALALGADPATDSAILASVLAEMEPSERARRIDRLERYFLRRVRVLVDGERIPFAVSFPTALTASADGQVPGAGSGEGAAAAGRGADAERAEIGPDLGPSFLGTVARVEGRLPPAALAVSVRISRSFPPMLLTVLRQDGAAPIAVDSGTPSPEIPRAAPPPPAGGRLFDTRQAFFAYGVWSMSGAGPVHGLFPLALACLTARPWLLG